MEVNGHQKLFATNILQNIFYRFGSTWWLNDDRIFIFGWTIPLAQMKRSQGPSFHTVTPSHYWLLKSLFVVSLSCFKEIPANAKEERSPVTKVVPHLTVSPKFHRHYSHMSPSMLAYDHAVAHGDARLRALLSPWAGRKETRRSWRCPPRTDAWRRRAMDSTAATWWTRPYRQWPERSQRSPPRVTASNDLRRVAMGDDGMAGSDSAQLRHRLPQRLPPSGPSIFNTEFLDVTDISLNSAWTCTWSTGEEKHHVHTQISRSSVWYCFITFHQNLNCFWLWILARMFWYWKQKDAPNGIGFKPRRP